MIVTKTVMYVTHPCLPALGTKSPTFVQLALFDSLISSIAISEWKPSPVIPSNLTFITQGTQIRLLQYKVLSYLP